MTVQSAPAGEITSDDKLWALLGYLLPPIVPIIVLLMEDKKSREYIKFHNIQSLALWVVWAVVGGLLSFIFVGFCIIVLGAIYSIYLGIQAYNGKTIPIPVLTDFIKKQGWA